MSLQAIAPGVRRRDSDPVRWLVFHRWTTEHVIAASGLLFAENGIVSCAVDAGFTRPDFEKLIRTVRTAVPDATAFGTEPAAEQEMWLRRSDDILKDLAKTRRLGLDLLVGMTPMEPCCCGCAAVIMDDRR